MNLVSVGMILFARFFITIVGSQLKYCKFSLSHTACLGSIPFSALSCPVRRPPSNPLHRTDPNAYMPACSVGRESLADYPTKAVLDVDATGTNSTPENDYVVVLQIYV